MVSEFLCECHGRLQIDGMEARDIIKVGANYDGYWKNEDLAKSLKEKAIHIFEKVHPNCKAIFCFDNSQNHHAVAPDGLCANKLNLGDGGKNTPKLRNTRFNGQEQKMQHEDGIQKGIRTILQERELWNPNLNLDCKGPCQGNCCQRYILSSQPDFLNQRSWLQEIVEDSCHEFLLFPKFHCEFNFIEMYWGEAKRKTRSKCEFTFQALEKNVPEALDSICLAHIRRYAQHCYRNMDCYRKGLEGKELERAMKKFKSHRSIPSSFIMN